jgi:hypothetical protein
MLRISLALVLLFTAAAVACEDLPDSGISAAIKGVASSDSAVVSNSIARLRNAGPTALTALLAQYDATPDSKLIPAIDAVAAQRGAVVSRLFWYTDLERARAAAKAENKPILYLRLMGKLTDEYSCANSRFFRTVLYSNADVSRLMREKFILVWVSERPVPVVTIDYGDGRVLKRTITGNSIHYVLDSDGRVIDALPGLYGPQAFAEILNSAGPGATAIKGRANLPAMYLARAEDGLLRAWQSDTQQATLPEMTLSATQVPVQANGRNPAPAAPLAMRRAVAKTVIEAPLLRQVAPQFGTVIDQSIDKADEATWEKIAALHAPQCRLDASSIALMKSQTPKTAADAAAFDRMVDQFQKRIALDTVHNNYSFRRQIIAWLRQSPGGLGVEELNQRVYSELFLTPKSDPWLGLSSNDVYTALTCDGCTAGNR